MFKDKKKIKAFVFCALLMLVTGISDSLRGVFKPEFTKVFSLSESQASKIIMMSYLGNFIFLLFGGYLSDRLPRKKYIGGLIIMWLMSISFYVFTESYSLMLPLMVVSLGASTALSTSVNVITPLLFLTPAMFVNIYNFLQGTGIAFSQNVIGRFSESMTAWHIANAAVVAVGLVCLLLLTRLELPDPEPKQKSSQGGLLPVLKEPATYLLIFIIGMYCVAEHGLMNWFTSYGSEYLGLSVPKASMYLSIFFALITVGRLLFAPLIERLGVFKSLLIWSTAAAALYSAGIFLGKSGILVLASSGLAFSILYPMMVVLIGRFFSPEISGFATGFVLSLSNLFDVFFNAFFGDLVDAAGYQKAMTVLPVTTMLFCILLFVLKFGVKKSKEIK